MIRASAPGKLMLSGEYTVLDPGGQALAVAVSPRVTVRLTLGGPRWRVTSPAMGLEDADPEEIPIVSAALASFPDLPNGGLIEIDSELGSPPDKPGLGSSAAVCVALVGALQYSVDGSAPQLDEVIAVHRAAQDGLGSGYDVAAALYGGVVVFDPTSEPPSARELPWPEGLHAAPIHTGVGASTAQMIREASEAIASGTQALLDARELLVRRHANLIAAFEAGEPSKVLDAVANAQEALEGFDRAAGLGIMGGHQRELLGAIEDAGAIGRTSGAGGGDCAWAMHEDPARVAMAVAAAVDLGFVRLDLTFPGKGLRVDEDTVTQERPFPAVNAE